MAFALQRPLLPRPLYLMSVEAASEQVRRLRRVLHVDECWQGFSIESADTANLSKCHAIAAARKTKAPRH